MAIPACQSRPGQIVVSCDTENVKFCSSSSASDGSHVALSHHLLSYIVKETCKMCVVVVVNTEFLVHRQCLQRSQSSPLLLQCARVFTQTFNTISYSDSTTVTPANTTCQSVQLNRVQQSLMPPHRSRAIYDHILLPATRQTRHSCLYPNLLKLVLSLATAEGCKAELT